MVCLHDGGHYEMVCLYGHTAHKQDADVEQTTYVTMDTIKWSLYTISEDQLTFMWSV